MFKGGRIRRGNAATDFFLGIAIASEKAAPTPDEVRELLMTLRYEEIWANTMEAYREHIRKVKPQITDEMWMEVLQACNVDDFLDIHISMISASFDREEIRQMTRAMRSPGGRQFAETLVNLALHGPEIYDPDFRFSPKMDPELKEFLELPIVKTWVERMPQVEAKTREVGQSWVAECLKATSLGVTSTDEKPSN